MLKLVKILAVTCGILGLCLSFGSLFIESAQKLNRIGVIILQLGFILALLAENKELKNTIVELKKQIVSENEICFSTDFSILQPDNFKSGIRSFVAKKLD